MPSQYPVIVPIPKHTITQYQLSVRTLGQFNPHIPHSALLGFQTRSNVLYAIAHCCLFMQILPLLDAKGFFCNCSSHQRIPDAFSVRDKTQHLDCFASDARIATTNCCVVDGWDPADVCYCMRRISVSCLNRRTECHFEQDIALGDDGVKEGCKRVRDVVCQTRARRWTASALLRRAGS
jgi:hypothetical protein